MAKPTGFRFQQHDTIGNPSAESDESFLSRCFVDTGALGILRDTRDARSIVLGRTGTGKTALLQTLAAEQERSRHLDPHDIALSYISNSSVLRFFEATGLCMDPFYRFLWRHLFVVEILKMRFNLDRESKRSNWWETKLMSILRKQSHRDSFEYLKTFGTDFIANTETQIKDVTTRVESDLRADASVSVSDLFNLGAEGVRKLSEESKFAVHQRGQDVLNGLQINKLASLFRALDEDILDDPKKRYFIVIDRLDENWIDDETRYHLIRTLIEIMKDFNSKVSNAKIIISLRVDLFERSLRETTDSGFQGEKYQGLCLPISWDAATLTELVDLRIAELVRRRWTGQPVTHTDILSGTIGKRKEKPLIYMLQRTLMRPRDIIAFFNACLSYAAKEHVIHPATLVRTEPIYSEQRLQSLVDEWSTEYPLLREICNLLKKQPDSFPLVGLSDDKLEDLSLRLADRISLPLTDDADCLSRFFHGEINSTELRIALAQILYRVGAIGLKPESYSQISWSYQGSAEMQAGQIGDTSKVYPHKMLWRALGINS